MEQKPAGPNDHLANERTFLAWIRTSIALIGFGFVIIKFALFLKQFGLVVNQATDTTYSGFSTIIGVVLIASGAVLSILAYIRYRDIEKQLNSNSYQPSRWLPLMVMLSIIVGSLLMILYLVLK